MARIDEALVGREQREDNYRKWSERAVIVGYNSENQSYDIVVTTERLVGANKRTLNKTIRRVKSILDSTVRVFLPGEAVTIGYLSDKREHPVILGLGDNVVQTPSKVTLGPTLNVESLEPSPIEEPIFEQTPCIGSIVDSITGSTQALTIDCGSLDIDGCARVFAQAPTNCGCGVYEWTGAGGLAGLTISDEGQDCTGVGLTTTLCPFGSGNSQLKICPPTNSPAVTGVAFAKIAWYRIDDALNRAIIQRFNCNSSLIDCLTPQHNGPTPTPIGGFVDFPICRNAPDTTVPADAACDSSPNPLATCFNVPTLPVPSSVCGTGAGCDARTDTMVAQGCHPCILDMDDLILTAIDACGRQTSIAIEVE